MNYVPNPIDTSRTVIDGEILKLTELLAKNAHEVWAKQRLSEGWKYGPNRNDLEKLHPCLVTYEELPESEKEYDRKTVMETIKVVLELGYNIVSNETSSFKFL
jgi:hypothetical protein